MISMKELLRTTDPSVIAYANALLQGEKIPCFEFDVNISVMEGGIGILPRRLMVANRDHTVAVQVMKDNGIEPST